MTISEKRKTLADAVYTIMVEEDMPELQTRDLAQILDKYPAAITGALRGDARFTHYRTDDNRVVWVLKGAN